MPATDVVIDASALLKLVIDEAESGTFTAWWEQHLRGGARLMAPHLIRYEVGQRLRRDVHESGLSPADRERLRDAALQGMAFADGATIEQWAPPLTFHDAAYVALAAATRAPLVTYDHAMRDVARQAGILVISP